MLTTVVLLCAIEGPPSAPPVQAPAVNPGAMRVAASPPAGGREYEPSKQSSGSAAPRSNAPYGPAAGSSAGAAAERPSASAEGARPAPTPAPRADKPAGDVGQIPNPCEINRELPECS